MSRMAHKRVSFANILVVALTRPTGALAATVLLVASSNVQAARPEEVAISRKDLVIDLGDDLKTDAQLTYPAERNGPCPGVVLVHGSGSTDMDGYVPAEVTGIGKPIRQYLLLAEYLSKRGFAVLRYHKRGVGAKGVTINKEVVLNKTVQALEQDVEKALATLMQQQEVDKNNITLIGRSEGAVIVPRVSIKHLSVKNVVLMSGGAHNLRDSLRYQIIERNVEMFQKIDTDDDGLISPREIEQLPPAVVGTVIDIRNEVKEFRAGLDQNKDGYLSIDDELEPVWLQAYKHYTTAEFPLSKWYQSHFALEPTLDIIAKVPANILILHGEEDRQCRVAEVRLLEERLTQAGHPDHTLIVYPGLGHTFHPVDGWLQPLGPPADRVLSDLVAWLKSPDRNRDGN